MESVFPDIIVFFFERVLGVRRIVANGPAVIVFWKNGDKTVVKCHGEDFDIEKGVAMALAKRVWGRANTLKIINMVEYQNDIHEDKPKQRGKTFFSIIFDEPFNHKED